MELLSTNDIFEDENIVIMETKCTSNGRNFLNIDVGIKDKNGDIEKIITVDRKISA